MRDRAAHAADHRPRDRRDEHDRPARRLVLRRGADRPARGARLRLLRARSTSSAGWSRRSSAASRSARSPTPPTSSSRSTTPRARILVGVNDFTEGDERRARAAPHRPGARAQADRPRAGRARPPRRRRRRAGARRAARAAAAGEANLMPHAARLRARTRHRRRDRRRAAGRVGHLHREPGLLTRHGEHVSRTRTSLMRGRPAGAPRPRSCSSIASQPRQVDERGHARPQPRARSRRRSRAGGSCQPAARQVVEQPRDGVGGALLVGADDARRPALDPADGVLAGPGRAVLLAHAAALVADQRRGARRTGRRAADGRGSRSSGSRARRGSPPARRWPPPGRRRADPARAGCAPRAGRSPARPRRRGSRPASGRSAARSRCDLPAGRRAANSRSMATFRRAVGEASSDSSHAALCRIELELGRVDDDVGTRQLAELAQLGIREGRLRRPATAEDDHFGDGGGGERRDRVVGGVGRRELVGVEHQHPRDVDRDVPVADHDGARARQVERLVGVRGVAVVPGDELGGGDRPRAVVAGDSQPVVGRRADRVDDRVVALEQLLAASRRRRARRRRRSGSPDAGPSCRTSA